jgi:hypothetical protein
MAKKTIKKDVTDQEAVQLDHSAMYVIEGTGKIDALPKGERHEVTGEIAELLIRTGRATLA